MLHLTTVRVLYGGQRRQLEFETRAANDYRLAWDTLALHVQEPRNTFERQIPRLFRGRVLLRVYGWITAARLSRQYDFILFRDMQLDVLGPILGAFVPRRITIHHAKEIEELGILRGGGWFSRIGAGLERYFKPLTMLSASGLAGVTGEIRDYELMRFPWLRDRALVIPNGYMFSDTAEVERTSVEGELSFAFVCAEFSPWHGLERLLAAIGEYEPRAGTTLAFHLVGELTPEQHRLVEAAVRGGIRIERHGSIDPSSVSGVLEGCDVALGSLALDEKGLREASTLKVREYLAAGLPVYATHRDAALPEDFPYFFEDEGGVSIARMVEYARSMANASRSEVREASRMYLDKGEIMRSVVLALQDLPASRRRQPHHASSPR